MYYYIYKDDGTLGLCGQSMSITMSWNKLIISKDPNTETDIIQRFSNTRKNPRLVGFFLDDEIHDDIIRL